MTSTLTVKPKAPAKAKLLVVDPERHAGATVASDCRARLGCEVFTASTLAEARAILDGQAVSLLLTDVKLPDGKGSTLVDELRRTCPHAAVVFTAKGARAKDALEALRCGANDFVDRPLSADDVEERIGSALRRQADASRADRRITRLRKTVRRLAAARKTVARKVDLLCNDLVGAYGELSRQVDNVRTVEDFRKVCDATQDIEQLLCHGMDWIMRRVGYSNIAVYLASEEQYQLGAYVKYTIASTPELTEALRDGVVARANREGFVRLGAAEAEAELSAAELRHLRGQSVVAANCTYLGESLATVVLFRDGNTVFTNDDAETFKAIAPVLAVALANQTRGPGHPEDDDAQQFLGEPPHDGTGDTENPDGKNPKDKRDDRNDADWWKRGEAPPF